MSLKKVDTPIHITLLHPDERQRTMLTKALGLISTSLQSGSKWEEIAHHPLHLGGIWVLFDQGEKTLQLVKQLRSSKEEAFWGILILGQGKSQAQQNLIVEGVDAYLTYPFDFDSLKAQLKAIAEKRTPISTYQVLPPQVAGGLDRVWARFSKLNYYELLELTPIAKPEEIKARFHHRSLLLHPDRHRSIKHSHLPVYERVNMIYKRVLEAYKILSDPLQRPLYDSALALGSVRWDNLLEERRKEILQMTQTEELQLALARTMSMRSRGLLKPAYDLVRSIAQKEPQNKELQTLVLGYQKLIELASRNTEVSAILNQQVAI